MMKNLLFLIFVSLVACQSVENVKQPEDVVPLTHDDVFKEDTTWKPVELPYTRIRPGKEKAFGRVLAKDLMLRRYADLTPQERKVVEEFQVNKLIELNSATFWFEEINGEIYFDYVTEALFFPIPLRAVEQYLE